MRQLKIIISFMLIIATLLLAVACDGKLPNDTQVTEAVTEASNETSDTQAPSDTTKPAPEETKVPKSIKILAIGNSFSVDAMQYLYQIAKDAGVKNIVLGVLRVSGCTLDMHYDYATNKTAAYRYMKNTTGTWNSTEGNTLLHGLQDEDWDIITLQQGSHESGLAEKYSNLKNLAEYVKDNATNSDVKLYWHMTWAYQEGCTYNGFANYNNDQMKMYNMIVNATKNKVLSLDLFEDVIPSGTAVQNVRTSFLGDNINRDDGYHMAQPMGRYLVGLAYFAALTGADISEITYTPSETASPEMIAMFKECVTNAINNKFAVTPSKYTKDSAENETPLKADAELAAEIGVDLSGYTRFDYEYVENKYWICNKYTTIRNASAAQAEKFICTETRYTSDQLSNAVIICDDGWQYRPELWPDETDAAETRPDNVSTPAVLLSLAWWGTNTYFAFNVSKTSGEKISSDYADAANHVRIYIPNNNK